MKISEKSLAETVLEQVSFRPISTGWLVGKCTLCNDYKERAGFKLDGDTLQYNCWNCSTSSSFKEDSGQISKKFRSILNGYGISDETINEHINSGFFLKRKETEKITLGDVTGPSLLTPEVKLPPKSIKLGGTYDFSDYQEKLIQYLVSRKIDVLSYPFYFSLDEKYLDRVIIPFYRNGKLIYWQARSIIRGEKERYLNCPAKRDAIIFNVDKLSAHSKTPLLVTEGVFDALCFNGICILGSKLNESKMHFLNKSPRRLIFVIDKDKNGRSLANTVIQNGWDITFAPGAARDINDSVLKYGKIWTAKELIKGIPTDANSAKLLIDTHCK